MRKLLIVTALLEAGAGVAFACWPSAMVWLLLGSGLDTSAAVAVGRLVGVALLTLTVACWLAHYDAKSLAARGLIGAMALYNAGAVAILGTAGLGSQPVGIALWPALVLHAGMAAWCITCVLRPLTEVAEKAD